jgi:hypothetical protein
VRSACAEWLLGKMNNQKAGLAGMKNRIKENERANVIAWYFWQFIYFFTVICQWLDCKCKSAGPELVADPTEPGW